jgi:hypothetical protein
LQDLFALRLRKSEKNDDVATRLRILIDDVTLFMYINVCRGLFEKDKLLYAFTMAANIHRQVMMMMMVMMVMMMMMMMRDRQATEFPRSILGRSGKCYLPFPASNLICPGGFSKCVRFAVRRV